jgi:hypothetical protein
LLVRLHRHSKVLRLLLPGAAAGRRHKDLLLLQLDLRQGHREHLLLSVLLAVLQLGVLLRVLLAVLQLGVLLRLHLRALQLRGPCRL